MPGKKGRSGRPPARGRLYRFSIRFREGVDPPELGILLEAIEEATGRKRADILRAALLGGSKQAGETAAMIEDGETTELIDDMFAGF